MRVIFKISDGHKQSGFGRMAFKQIVSSARKDGAKQAMCSGVKSTSVMKPQVDDNNVSDGSDEGGTLGGEEFSVTPPGTGISAFNVEKQGLSSWGGDMRGEDAAGCGGGHRGS